MQSSAQLAPLPTRLPAQEAVQSSPLWIAIHFHSLALTALGLGEEDLAVVTESSQRGAVVYQASANARSAGIAPGLGINAALAICESLVTHRRDQRAEQRYIRRFHRRVSRFTPAVSLSLPATLVFDVTASLKLFGGIENLCKLIHDDLARFGGDYCMAAAPTPAASSILAGAGREIIVMEKAELRGRLGALPVRFLGIPASMYGKLRAIGVASLQELWRLPRSDLARRFGPALVRQIDQLLGIHPDPRDTDFPAPEFESRYELEAETDQTDVILLAAKSLLQRLLEFLRRIDADAKEVLVLLHHRDKPATHIIIRTRLPTRNLKQWLELLRERIIQNGMSGPVVSVSIASQHFQSARPLSGDFFDTGESVVRDWACTLDELEARLGGDSLWQPGLNADHRPEHAWRRSVHGREQPTAIANSRRPLWLLPRPQPLRYREGVVWHAQPLRVIDGPERIESGWWDGDEYCRDYYTAVSPRNGQLWIFREIRKDQWFLHGYFG